MEANPSLPVRSIPELLAYAKANPGRVNMGAVGIGSGPHLAGELFKMMAGVEVVLVSYRGTGAELVDLMSGDIQMCFDAIPGSIEIIRAGKLRALGVTTGTRSDMLPDVPTLGEFLPGYEASFWVGLGAPKNTPVEIIHKLNTEINATLADVSLKTRLGSLGATVLAGSPPDFGKLIAAETEKWGNVIRTANLKAE
jgi:tripartite-type tricarboxylate transporter receptor subunit TctC